MKFGQETLAPPHSQSSKKRLAWVIMGKACLAPDKICVLAGISCRLQVDINIKAEYKQPE